jgi:hypothetical protein
MAIGNYLGWVSVTSTNEPVDIHMTILGIALLVGIVCIMIGLLSGRRSGNDKELGGK